MKTIAEKLPVVKALLQVQPIESGTAYRRASFCLLTEEAGVPLAYNTLTQEIVALTDAEQALLRDGATAEAPEAAELIKDWFMVPALHDDLQLTDEVREFVQAMRKKEGYHNFTIFTTTDCNARCFYCYELGRKRIPMSPETAAATAKFILGECGGKSVGLTWYGGEPLYNAQAIDIVCSALRDAGVEYRSKMATNGYLFDDATVQKAIGLWGLDRVQITLDGTEQVYNRVKAYIDRKGNSPFLTVLDNVERLLAAGIRVNIRLNVDDHNIEDMYRLAELLAARFGENKGFSVYIAVLFELEGVQKAKHTPTERVALAKRVLALGDLLESKGVCIAPKLPRDVVLGYCMADSSTAMAITSEGNLVKCDYYTDDHFVGNVFDGVSEPLLAEQKANFAQKATCRELCGDCPMYPICIRLKNCPSEGYYICDSAKRLMKCEDVRRSVRRVYRESQTQQ